MTKTVCVTERIYQNQTPIGVAYRLRLDRELGQMGTGWCFLSIDDTHDADRKLKLMLKSDFTVKYPEYASYLDYPAPCELEIVNGVIVKVQYAVFYKIWYKICRKI